MIICAVSFLYVQSSFAEKKKQSHDSNIEIFKTVQKKFNIKASADTKKYYAEIDYPDGLRRIDGWFDKHVIILLLVIDDVQAKNNITGNVGEIGVWQGRSFIPLMHLVRQDECALAMDCFELYQFNLDNSGGNMPKLLEMFTNNVKAYCSNFDVLRVIKGNSLELSSHDYLGKMENGKGFRIFSIDGCHEAQATIIDMKNVCECLVPGGVIEIDDYFNPSWPGVSEGVNAFMRENPNRLKPFFIGWNKVFFTHTEYAQLYSDMFKKFFVPQDLTIKKFFNVATLIYDKKP